MLERHNKEAEIELIDILNVFFKRKNIIIIGTIIITLIATGIAVILPNTYRISAIIEPGKRPITDQNGQIVEEKYIDSSLSLRETIIGGAYDEFISKQLDIKEDQLPKINVSIPQKTELIEISIKSKKPQLAMDIMTELLKRISDDLQKKVVFEKHKVDSEVRVAAIENQNSKEQIKLIETQILETRNKIKFFEESRKKAMSSNPNEAMAILLYSKEIKDGQIYLNELQDKIKEYEMQSKKSFSKIENLKNKLSMIKTIDIYKTPYIPDEAIGPNKEAIIIAGFVLGFFVTTAAAFLLEYISNRKRDVNKSV
jgi:LPS O-antigen subunit length determinant protein (WzzB/FepE family)